ncbi:hypothetical protein CO115_02590 [Candidatus Falkowbacteria bacterium CG_4_9_14_3_um_filter_36_9]|uniref:Glycosyl transferase family 1 domain-containing protein n=2 Tax=Candidatus Falkowiibacteriota TaxID=1752728 RepID=A0A1J4TCQ5_9BACT|nr:MAG: hypothetical protein AUJ27_00285 [Candidatus Falkowbacteria bacterium CG1_02_37_44]PIV50756.1 MAG: hypothetical protein COS18_03930 [Candidatus Falkowbacteria bacterium CG02_land_8_20_14_3_00_36_14]PIX11948.1 MAG: hypothetical protein COZ73_01390 [Candidatus Falkowbacteria bacterium CG_4_8_14_3_um_filter_36_11]PJA10539.1 MAG: hypothetical protein COX67_04365 [Candidatus Falkowbacteria bacterium CG_4_10_14_0_2_um_filter_36_22]PJB19609.1 MAG: hypothetical protein CO115_02590 [Candidatus F
MKLIYCTSIALSNKLANRAQVYSMAKQFQKKMGEFFFLGVNYTNIDDRKLNIICFNNRKSYILAWKYIKFIKNNKIDYIYCREARLLFFIILYSKLFLRFKLIFTYEVHSFFQRNMIDELVDRFLSRYVNNFIFVTKNLADRYIIKYSISKNKTLVSPDGVDLEIFNINLSKEGARKKLGLPFDKKIIIYTGKFKTMGMDKGINDILKVLKIINDNNLLFVAVGGSKNELDYYNKLANQLNTQEKVKLFGMTTQDNLAIYQKAADALLMPFPHNTHYAYYMSPLKMFEYMASKQPIIASDLPSIREVLNKNNSIIVKPERPDELAKGVKIALEDKNLVKKITEQAFQDVGRYTWKIRVEDILEFIKCV